MEEPFDRRIMLLSAMLEGLGQLVSGRTAKGLLLIGTGTLFAALGGVLGTLLKLLTFGRRPIKALPDRLNPLALAWLAIYLYSLYDAYNLASGVEDEADLFDYEEYEPQEGAGAIGTTVAAEPAAPVATGTTLTGAPAASANGSAPAAPVAPAADLGNAGANVAALGSAADQLDSGDGAVGGTGALEAGGATASAEAATPADAAALPASESTAPADENTPPAEASGRVTGAPAFDLGGLDWAGGVTKTQLMDVLGDDAQVRGVFGQYLPSDRVFHSSDEALNLIPVQAWQSAQGRDWTGGEMPDGDEPSGYLDSVTGQMPSGDQSAGTIQ